MVIVVNVIITHPFLAQAIWICKCKRQAMPVPFPPDERSWQERQRLDLRKRDRRGYKRPDAGKRPKTHRGATGSSISRKKRGNKQSTGRATHNQRMKREGAFIVNEEQEEEPAIRAAPCLQDQFTSKETEEEEEDMEKQRE